MNKPPVGPVNQKAGPGLVGVSSRTRLFRGPIARELAPTVVRAFVQGACLVLVMVLLTACGGGHNARPSSGGGKRSGGSSRPYDDISRSQGSRYGSKNDSVPTEMPDFSKIPEPVPKNEPRSLYGNKSPYSVLGQTYNVLPTPKGYVERGIASFYGNKFHGYKTSNLEEYDMYQFSAAHKTLPLPSYARVTNLENGKSVIVRINDRGPFHENRIIDLSFAAAVKIGVWPSGTGLVEVRAIDPSDPSSASAPPFVQTAPKPAPVTAPPPPSRPSRTPPPPAARTAPTAGAARSSPRPSACTAQTAPARCPTPTPRGSTTATAPSCARSTGRRPPPARLLSRRAARPRGSSGAAPA